MVTGGAKGIGARVAHRFSNAGYAVAVAYRNSEQAARALAEDLTACGRKAVALQADLSTAAGAETLRRGVFEAFGRADVLVNNAGSCAYGLLASMSDRQIEAVLADNLRSVVYVCRAFYDDFAFGKKGNIINISSVWGLKGASTESVYAAAKAGVIGLTKSLAKELAPSGVRVNAVAPGAIMTDMLARFSAEELEDVRKEIPIGRLGDPDDIARAVLFLASDKASYITGEVWNVSGGYVI